MNTAVYRYVGELVHDRIVGALELCRRRGEMLLIQNRRVNWDTCQIGIPGATAKDRENRRIPFNPKGRLAAILERRATLGPDAFEKEGEEWNRQQLNASKLEESRTTASAGDGKLMRWRMSARLSRICPGDREKLAPQVGFEPTTLRLTA